MTFCNINYEYKRYKYDYFNFIIRAYQRYLYPSIQMNNEYNDICICNKKHTPSGVFNRFSLWKGIYDWRVNTGSIFKSHDYLRDWRQVT